MSEAGRKVFAVSRKNKRKTNDSEDGASALSFSTTCQSFDYAENPTYPSPRGDKKVAIKIIQNIKSLEQSSRNNNLPGYRVHLTP